MTQASARHSLAAYPRVVRAVIALCAAAAAVIALLIPGPLPARLLGAVFYGVIAWLAAAAVHDLVFGARVGGPTRAPLPGLWRVRIASDGTTPRIVVPLHLDPDDSEAVRTFALGTVLLAIGLYAAITGRHGAHLGVIVAVTAICVVLAIVCLLGTGPGLYRKASRHNALTLDPYGVGLVDGGLVGWDEIAAVGIADERVSPPGRRAEVVRRYLTVSTRRSHRAPVRVDVTGVSNPRGVLAVIDAYRAAGPARSTLGSRASLWHVRRLRHSWRKTPTRLTP